MSFITIFHPFSLSVSCFCCRGRSLLVPSRRATRSHKLLKLGADLFARNNVGNTAIELADSRDQTKTVIFLKQAAEKGRG